MSRLVLAFCLGLAAATIFGATPRGEPEVEIAPPVSPVGTPALLGAPQPFPQPRVSPVQSVNGKATQPSAPLSAVTWTGTINYANAKWGRFYLAIPAGKGVTVEICGPAGCVTRTSTDAGPDLARQRAGKIADLNITDWLAISGVPLKYGGFSGTVLVLKRHVPKLPETDTR